MDIKLYQGMIIFFYLTTSRPDIMYNVCLYVRFQACPKESHLNVNVFFDVLLKLGMLVCGIQI